MESVIICSRTDSKRLHQKPLIRFLNKPLIEHLVDRLGKSLKTILSIPENDYNNYSFLEGKAYIHPVKIFDKSPLHRMFYTANEFNVKHVIRVTHDKLFVDPNYIKEVLNRHIINNQKYTYISGKTKGIGFEIIDIEVLRQIASNYTCDIEHISYYAKQITNGGVAHVLPEDLNLDCRLLIDYTEDLLLINALLNILGSDASVSSVIQYLRRNYALTKINRLPVITFYTCAYNSAKTINTTLRSVFTIMKLLPVDCEYLVIDDCSKDNTYENIVLTSTYDAPNNVKWFKNEKNIGLAASSNLALDAARGKYIIRIDADDWLCESETYEFIKYALEKDVDAIYPANYYGDFNTIQRPEEAHHVGGAMFKLDTLRAFKFNPQLRNLEGFDLFHRAKNLLNPQYYNKPTFFYRQSNDSMSKINLEERKEIREKILKNEL